MNEHLLLWALPALMALSVAAQLYARRVVVGWSSMHWRYVEKSIDPSRYWLFIVAEVVAVLVLIGQAATA